MIVIGEQEFSEALRHELCNLPGRVGSVTGPGRSGAIASAFASHFLNVPFIPFGATAPIHLGDLLIIDTATFSGRTLRKACRRYEYAEPICLAVYHEPPRVAFWYEAQFRLVVQMEERFATDEEVAGSSPAKPARDKCAVMAIESNGAPTDSACPLDLQLSTVV